MPVGESNKNYTLTMDTGEGNSIGLEFSDMENDHGIHINNKLSFKHNVSLQSAKKIESAAD